jgi:hypothetical protein
MPPSILDVFAVRPPGLDAELLLKGDKPGLKINVSVDREQAVQDVGKSPDQCRLDLSALGLTVD